MISNGKMEQGEFINTFDAEEIDAEFRALTNEAFPDGCTAFVVGDIENKKMVVMLAFSDVFIDKGLQEDLKSLIAAFIDRTKSAPSGKKE